MKKSHIVMLLTFLLLIPATIYFGLRFSGRAYYVTSTLVMIETLVPFLLAFENRKPQARELVVIAVLSALAVAARVVIPIPNFKAIFAIIMLSGIAFGPETGFLVGAISAFASNFFFSQGPWTPWQMFAYGFAGFWAGLIFHGRQKWCKPWILGIFGFLSILLLVGPMLDCCTVFTVLSKLTWKNVLFIFGQGVPVNTVHGIGCSVTLMVLTKPLLYKLNRIQKKYGMMDGGQAQ